MKIVRIARILLLVVYYTLYCAVSMFRWMFSQLILLFSLNNFYIEPVCCVNNNNVTDYEFQFHNNYYLTYPDYNVDCVQRSRRIARLSENCFYSFLWTCIQFSTCSSYVPFVSIGSDSQYYEIHLDNAAARTMVVPFLFRDAIESYAEWMRWFLLTKSQLNVNEPKKRQNYQLCHVAREHGSLVRARTYDVQHTSRKHICQLWNDIYDESIQYIGGIVEVTTKSTGN